MSILTKIKWVASILLVFFIVLATNLIDKGNYNRLRNSVTTIYEDRIVASDVLFELSVLIQKKEIAVLSSDPLFFKKENEKVNHDIDNLTEAYGQTKLIGNERVLYNHLVEELNALKGIEKGYTPTSKSKPSLLKSIDKIDEYLHDLSKIQLREARKQMLISNDTMDMINLFTQGEIIFLIVMGLLVQIIILYKPKES